MRSTGSEWPAALCGLINSCRVQYDEDDLMEAAMTNALKQTSAFPARPSR